MPGRLSSRMSRASRIATRWSSSSPKAAISRRLCCRGQCAGTSNTVFCSTATRPWFLIKEQAGLMAETGRDRQLDAIVNEVVAEAHLNRSLLLPEEIEYIREHALNKPLGVIHIWALGVGVVITGMYFGWNFGLPVGGPVGVLVASLIVCVLYLAWVLALSELSVAMPFAGGPLAFGRRAVGKWFGFLMGWSMFLECLFATIGTGLATGGYIAFLLNPDHPDRKVTTAFAILCALVFFVIQYIGVKQQAVIMLWLTYAAIGALVWFWAGVAPGVSLDRVF